MNVVARGLNRLIEFMIGVKAADRAQEIIHEVEFYNAQKYVQQSSRHYWGQECPRCSKSNIVNTLPVASGGIFGGTTNYFKCNDCNHV